MAEQNGKGPAAALFDVDGTLVDTNYPHAVTWWEAALDSADWQWKALGSPGPDGGTMINTRTSKNTGLSRQRMVGIYLNDHLAGATAGTELAHRMAQSHRDQEEGSDLMGLAAEIGRDRAALLDMMVSLGVTVRGYKVGAAWIGEKAGRLKLNGRLLARSPVSDLEELELLRLGVEGKAAGWRTLRIQADTDARLDARRLDELISRANIQAAQIEELRVRAASRIITHP